MKKIFSLFFVAISLSLWAEPKEKVGVGVILGDPTGLSANYIFEPNRSVDAAIAYSFDNDDKLYLHSTYLFRNPNRVKLGGAANAGWYYGIGGRFIYEEDVKDNIRLGVRGALGANMNFKKIPIELFAELAPVVDIVKETDFGLDAGIGVRIYF